jgi:hypothetical protein
VIRQSQGSGSHICRVVGRCAALLHRNHDEVMGAEQLRMRLECEVPGLWEWRQGYQLERMLVDGYGN